MAYAAAISLKQTTDRLLNPSPHISIIISPSDQEILRVACEEAVSLQQFLQLWDIMESGSDAKKMSFRTLKPHFSINQCPPEYKIAEFVHDHVWPLRAFLRDCFKVNNRVGVSEYNYRFQEAVGKLEDVLENAALQLDQPFLASMDWEELKHEINSFVETVTKIKEERGEVKPLKKNTSIVTHFGDELSKLQDLISDIMKSADRETVSVLERLERHRSSDRVNALDDKIREAICRLEDAIEHHVLNQFHLQSKNHPLSFSLDLQEVKLNIDSITNSVQKLKEDYINELSKPLLEEENIAGPSRNDFSDGKKSKMIGFSDIFGKIKRDLLSTSPNTVSICQVVGMAGIGKTTVAEEVFNDKSISECFELRAWVTLGQGYEYKNLVQDILAQLNPKTDIKMLTCGYYKKLNEHLRISLWGRKFLIVLDDVWNPEFYYDYLKEAFPEDRNGSWILLTTRKTSVQVRLATTPFKMRFLNKEEGWALLREKVFGEELVCTPELEKAGKKIVKNCDGLPLTIVTVASLLSKVEKTPEYWNEVAEKRNSVFTDAYDQMHKVLLPSYRHLQQQLKAFFLYMGVFPETYEIPLSKLMKLWCAEGFRENYLQIRNVREECLTQLDCNSLMITNYRSNGNINTCRLHSAYWHLCRTEAGKSKFFHVLNRRQDGFAESIKSQRRLCILNNVLLAIKDVYDSMASISTARSLLCTGPYHQYAVPICSDSKVLRVVDALSIRFYEFPMAVLELVQLRYLSLTCDGSIPDSISKLWNLQFLIVLKHLRIVNSSQDLPVEIWDMKELKHLQVMGSDLPDPPCGALLPNLQTLIDVSAKSCTEGVLAGLPNLEKLGIRIELAPSADASEFVNHISHLHQLNTVKCVIVNPNLGSVVAHPRVPLSIFSSRLEKLTLSDLGYPWEELRVIGSLEHLKVLKLQCYAFTGPKWEVDEDHGYQSLDIIQIEDSDLVHWTRETGSFQFLKHIILKHCYKLEELPGGYWNYLWTIELVDCNPLAVNCAKQIEEDDQDRPYKDCCPVKVNVQSSASDVKLSS